MLCRSIKVLTVHTPATALCGFVLQLRYWQSCITDSYLSKIYWLENIHNTFSDTRSSYSGNPVIVVKCWQLRFIIYIACNTLLCRPSPSPSSSPGPTPGHWAIFGLKALGLRSSVVSTASCRTAALSTLLQQFEQLHPSQ